MKLSKANIKITKALNNILQIKNANTKKYETRDINTYFFIRSHRQKECDNPMGQV